MRHTTAEGKSMSVVYERLNQREAKMVRYGLHRGQDSIRFALK